MVIMGALSQLIVPQVLTGEQCLTRSTSNRPSYANALPDVYRLLRERIAGLVYTNKTNIGTGMLSFDANGTTVALVDAALENLAVIGRERSLRFPEVTTARSCSIFLPRQSAEVRGRTLNPFSKLKEQIR